MQIKDCTLIEPYICGESDNLVEVGKKLRKTTLRHIFVVSQSMAPVGIISVIDMNNRVVAEGKDPKALKASDVMSKVDVVHSTDDASAVAKQMMERNRVMNPVVNDGKMVGIITLNELVRRK